MRIRIISSTVDNVDLELPDNSRVEWIDKGMLGIYRTPVEGELEKLGEFRHVECWFVVAYYREEE